MGVCEKQSESEHICPACLCFAGVGEHRGQWQAIRRGRSWVGVAWLRPRAVGLPGAGGPPGGEPAKGGGLRRGVDGLHKPVQGPSQRLSMMGSAAAGHRQ